MIRVVVTAIIRTLVLGQVQILGQVQAQIMEVIAAVVGSDKATTSMGMDEKTGLRINDNGDMSKSIVVTNPTPQKPIIPTSPTEPGNPDMKCAVILSLGSNCKPEQHPQQPPGEGPDHDCLIHPELTKCKSDNGRCPDGFNQNEDGDCFAKHDKCPSGFHSHEDDETGRCN